MKLQADRPAPSYFSDFVFAEPLLGVRAIPLGFRNTFFIGRG